MSSMIDGCVNGSGSVNTHEIACSVPHCARGMSKLCSRRVRRSKSTKTVLGSSSDDRERGRFTLSSAMT